MAPQRPIGFWLKLVDQLINEQFDGILDEHGVTRRQWQVMSLLSNGEASRVQLDDALAPFVSGPEPESLDEELDELAASGWVELRAAVFALTERGQTSFDRLSVVVDRSRDVLAEDISAEEYNGTLGVLERMARNLGWRDPVNRP